jgi:hypothetical protein
MICANFSALERYFNEWLTMPSLIKVKGDFNHEKIFMPTLNFGVSSLEQSLVNKNERH